MLREGSVISFDELFGHEVVKNHEWKALQEVAAKWAFSYRFITWMLHPDSKYGRAVRTDREEHIKRTTPRIGEASNMVDLLQPHCSA